MAGFAWRAAAGAVGAVVLAASQPAGAAGPRETESFAIGTQGALCEAQGVMLGEARASLFDRKWALICADVDRPIGTAWSWKGASDIGERLGHWRDARIECDTRLESDAVPGAVVHHCREQGSNLEWVSYAAPADGWLHVVEGYAAFDGALRLALASLVENRVVPGTVDIVTIGSSGSLAAARAAVGGEQLIGQGYRRNNAGEYTEAEEFFRPLPGETGDIAANATLAERRHETTVNRALQLSNLGRYDEAARLFAEARAMGLRDGIQARLLRNFEAIDALNRGELEAVAPILARAVPDVALPAEAGRGGVEIDAPLAVSLNSGLAAGLVDAVAQEARLTRAERAALIDAQARQLGGTVLRLQGREDEAIGQFFAAREAILQVKEGRVLSAARLEAQVLSEMALAHEAAGRFGEADARLREALVLTELRYPGSASVEAAKARLAAFLARRGRRDESLALYRGIVAEVAADRSALVGLENQLRPYLAMLIEDLPGKPALIGDLFLATQLIERPGAAQTLAQLARQLSAGTGEAAGLFRRANAVDRELTRVNLAIAQANAQEGAAPASLPELQDRRSRLEGMQLELFDALSAYPEYRSVAHAYVTFDEMKTLLRPGEGYLKLVRMGDEMFAVYLSPERAAAWQVDASSGEVADLVAALRDSISLSIGGVNATYPFDVDSARRLHDALFGPVAGDLARLDHLVFEPDGALLQLPVNLLTADQAGVDAYHARVEAGGDEFDFRGIRWLGRDKAISTALSAASFRDARAAPSSPAGRAYIGLGENAPLDNLTRAALVRGSEAPADPACDVPLASWNRPIPDDELVLAAQVFGPERSAVVTGSAFTDTAVEQRGDLDMFRIVHFATHGLVTPPREGCPAQPALLTSFGGPGSDGLLEFAEVFDLDLDADLVILSACDTASMAGLEATRLAGLESGGGQALDGLVRAFIGAGGRQVIASHWSAPEEFEATERLFGAFFRSAPGVSQGAALLAAQQALMDDPATSHPFYWAGFALIGDGERPLFAGS
ncbi:MAG TPA: CHAT domain-containing protein [Croceibacterium sp.]|nr:CHAT domain-containing protein [Croceibacterium sp.]